MTESKSGNSAESDLHDKEMGTSASRSLPDEGTLKELIASVVTKQERAQTTPCDEGITSLLSRCLSREAPTRSLFALSAYVDHYNSKHQEDLGWGCGWRNIQMLSSNLLRRDRESMAALFGGAGFVPSIAGLQLWLEIAWKQGFDTVGAEQLGWAVSSTQKWIGTTECAALLRSFGFRAFIVDFKSSVGQKGRSQPHAPPAATRGAAEGQQKRKPSETGMEQSDAKRGEMSKQVSGNWGSIGGGEGEEERGGRRPRSASKGEASGDQEEEGATDDDRLPSSFGQGKVADVNRLVSREHYSYCPECKEKISKGSEHTHDEEEDSDEGISSPSKQGAEEGESKGGGKEGEEEGDKEGDDAKAVKSFGTPHEANQDDKGNKEGEDKRAGGSRGDENPGLANHMRLVEWVWDYFTGGDKGGAAPEPQLHTPSSSEEGPGQHWQGSNARWQGSSDATDGNKSSHNIISNRPPLYFQHQGHSRTIVGIERRPPQRPRATEDVYLLVLDPSQGTEELVRALRAGKGWQRMVKRSVYTLRKAEYQLCYVEPGLASGDELESLKVLQSVLYSY